MPSGRPVAGSASGRRTAGSWAGPRRDDDDERSGRAGTASPWPPTVSGPSWASAPRRPPGRPPSGSRSCFPPPAGGRSRRAGQGRAAATARILPLTPAGALPPGAGPASVGGAGPAGPGRASPSSAPQPPGGGGAPVRRGATASPFATGGAGPGVPPWPTRRSRSPPAGRAVPAVLRAADGRTEARWLPGPGGRRRRTPPGPGAGIPPVCRAEIAGRSETDRWRSPEELAHRRPRRPRSTPPCGRRWPAAGSPRSAGAGVSKKLAAAEAFLTALTADDATIPSDRRRRRSRRGTADASCGTGGAAGSRPPGRCAPASGSFPPTEPRRRQTTDAPATSRGGSRSSSSRPRTRASSSRPRTCGTTGRPPSRCRHSVDDPGGHLLADLGRASRLWPGLDSGAGRPRTRRRWSSTPPAGNASSATPRPSSNRPGFGILVPPWWKQRTRLGLRLRARPRPVSVSLRWTGHRAGRPVRLPLRDRRRRRHPHRQELQHLAELKAPLVRVRGQWVELRAGDVERALAVLTAPRRTTRAGAGAIVDDEMTAPPER